MKDSKPIPFDQLDTFDQFAKMLEVVSHIDDSTYYRFVRREAEAAAAAAQHEPLVYKTTPEQELLWWAMCQKFQRLQCADIAKCADLRCR
jgi:hypothetical protein